MLGRAPHETRDPREAAEFRLVAGSLAAAGVALAVLGCWVVAQATGTGHGSPIEWVKAWFDDRPAWTSLATLTLMLLLGAAAAAAAVTVRRFGLVDRYRRRKVLRRVDRKARLLSGREDQVDLTRKSCAQFTAKHAIPADFPPGLSLGKSVAFGTPLWVKYELTTLVIKGPRQGKTTSLVVPQVVAHAGPALVCSNKRDVHDLLRGPRSQIDVVWVHDMQQIAQQDPDWWWNPLSFITAGDDMVSRAARLAGAWQACHASHNSSTDAYFGPGGETLLANLLVAAAVSNLSAEAAMEWLGDLHGRTGDLPDPVAVLEEHGFKVAATELRDTRELTSRQLDGLVGTARGILSFLREETFRSWITPDSTRREFKPAEFVDSSQTLILLSKNTVGPSGRAIVTALTMAVTDAALTRAQRSKGGRLTRPLLLMLDEAANICPWPELPELYSYLGSHGIIPVTILQNHAQGVKAWRAEGMEALVSSSNVMVIGGGNNSTSHLRDIAQLIGDYWINRSSTNRGHKWDSKTTGRSLHKEEIFSISDLRAWPAGRAIVFASSARPIIIKMIPWHQGEYADQIGESERFYAPSGEDDPTWDDEVDVAADEDLVAT